MRYQLCSFTWVCYMEIFYSYRLCPTRSRGGVNVRTLAVYTIEYLESHIRIWNPTMLAQICFTMAKSYIFYLRAFPLWLVFILITAEPTPELVEKDTPAFINFQVDLIFFALFFLLSRFISPPSRTDWGVTSFAILLNVHVGLFLTRSRPAVRGATYGVCFVHLLLNLHATFEGLVALRG